MKIITILFLTLCLCAKAQYTKFLDFNITNGSTPRGSLISDGTSTNCGVYSCGVIIKIKPDGTAYTKLMDFTGPNGEYPDGTLFFDGTYLYGMTEAGGANNKGLIFRIKPDGTGDTTLLNFS